MLHYEDFEEKTISRQAIFKGKIIDVYLDEVALPKGGVGHRELVFHQGAVGIFAVTPEEKIVLVRQFRKPLEKVVLEIPAGKIESGEGHSPVETGARELEEETAYRAKSLEWLVSMYLSPGFSNELIHLYHAKDLVTVSNPLPQDEDEVLEVVELTLSEAKEKIRIQEICDAKTIYAIQYWELFLNKERD